MDASAWEFLGLYDPADGHAKLRLELLEYLTSLGATTDELPAYRDALPALAMVLVVRGGAAMTLHEAATKSGQPEHVMASCNGRQRRAVVLTAASDWQSPQQQVTHLRTGVGPSPRGRFSDRPRRSPLGIR